METIFYLLKNNSILCKNMHYLIKEQNMQKYTLKSFGIKTYSDRETRLYRIRF